MFVRQAFRLGKVGAQLRSFSASCSQSAKLELSKRDILADERISIRVLDVPYSSQLTICTELNDEDQKLFFRSVNEFQTEESSSVLDLGESRPTNGYSSIDPMGIFWSMEKHGDNGSHNLLVNDVEQPLDFTITVEDENGNTLCSDSVLRHTLAPGVKRIQIKEGRIRGTLFLPPPNSTNHQHPGILNIDGGIQNGQLIEDEAAMLAARGFATLSLAFYGVDDLPRNYKTLDAEYFEEAIDYLISREDVLTKNGIGILGVSKGGDIAQSLACLRPDVVGAVCIQNSSTAPVLCPLTKNGESYGSAAEVDLGSIKLKEDGSYDIVKVVLVPEIDSHLNIPIEKYPGNVLWIVGEDDGNFDSLEFARNAEARAQRSNKHNFQLSVHPGMGHFIRLPFVPLTSHAPHPFLPKGTLIHFGGNPMDQAKGQENAWHEKIQFFKDSLL